MFAFKYVAVMYPCISCLVSMNRKCEARVCSALSAHKKYEAVRSYEYLDSVYAQLINRAKQREARAKLEGCHSLLHF